MKQTRNPELKVKNKAAMMMTIGYLPAVCSAAPTLSVSVALMEFVADFANLPCSFSPMT